MLDRRLAAGVGPGVVRELELPYFGMRRAQLSNVVFVEPIWIPDAAVSGGKNCESTLLPSPDATVGRIG